jgi:hypothetical protein
LEDPPEKRNDRSEDNTDDYDDGDGDNDDDDDRRN